jgi:hypothetical protein
MSIRSSSVPSGLAIAIAVLQTTACGTSYDENWYEENTISQRQLVEVPRYGQQLDAQAIKEKLKSYDPGSLMRCAVEDDEAYRTVADQLGGTSWGYSIQMLEDLSKPAFRSGVKKRLMMYPQAEAGGGGSDVEIAESDIVGISATHALFYSRYHGLLMVDLSSQKPVFKCAAQLPGKVSEFFFYENHLIVMAAKHRYGNDRRSFLLHFKLENDALNFVEGVDLGPVSILDTRRFNDQLVIYTDFSPMVPIVAPAEAANDNQGEPTDNNAAGAPAASEPYYYGSYSQTSDRALRIFSIGDQLKDEFNDTLLDNTESEAYLVNQVIDPAMKYGTVVSESTRYGANIWASDHYFVVTQAVSKTRFSGWRTRYYSVCTESHFVDRPYRHCTTQFQEQPNPNYVAPDNSGGDRSCEGKTLSTCLQDVSKASNKTIQVPVGTNCVESIMKDWICDKQEHRSHTYATFDTEEATNLLIYEYTENGFIRLNSKVHEITTAGLEFKGPEDAVDKLTTSTEPAELMVEGALQTLYFQDGYLYVISAGNLQVYAMGGSSLVRTSSQKLVNDKLETSLFTEDQLFLSDFRYSYGGHHDLSTLKVVDLSNPAFPRQVSKSHELPGGHNTILPTSEGILTIGTVQNYSSTIQSVIKLGLFGAPYAEELAYLIIGTDLAYNNLGEERSHYYDRFDKRLFLPYSGFQKSTSDRRYRLGISRLDSGTIKSEGAIEVPESLRRVRPRPNSAQEYLGFSENSISLFSTKNGQWEKEDVLAYFNPIALYRLTEKDDWLEVLRLGNECKFHFAKKDELNERDASKISKRIPCYGNRIEAFGHNLIFSETSGFRFTLEGEVTALTPKDIAPIRWAIHNRPYCLFSRDEVDFDRIDFSSPPPPLSGLTCMSSEEYDELRW